MAICHLRDRKKKARSLIYDHNLPYGENIVKIGLVDPEMICLK